MEASRVYSASCSLCFYLFKDPNQPTTVADLCCGGVITFARKSWQLQSLNMAVTIYYFPIRGRGEVLKLLCAAKGIEFEVKDFDYQQMKSDRQQYPFGQCPRLVDGDIDLCQSNAIIRCARSSTSVDRLSLLATQLLLPWGMMSHEAAQSQPSCNAAGIWLASTGCMAAVRLTWAWLTC
eukprot:GHUV01028867.1.p1 GENE.GHUV01028867.1~~GHUV01028867.1.p1  ORF type:complete len:179 (+),score=25.99 GHUV01028867.1:2-538(+)